MSFFEDLFRKLNENGVRYVVVGGVAVVLHGHPRMTADIDLAVDLDRKAAALAIRALTGMGLRPRVPVEPEAFADPSQRERWIEERGMRVFNLYDPNDPLDVNHTAVLLEANDAAESGVPNSLGGPITLDY